MLMKLADLISEYEMNITGVVHLGAHLAEEAPIYAAAGIHKVVWVEGNISLIPALHQKVYPYWGRVIHSVVADSERMVTLNIANETMCSSIYALGTQADFAPETEYVEQQTYMADTLDGLAEIHRFLHRGYNFLNMDLQGGELMALRGGTKYLEDVEYVYTEVNEEYVYRDEPLIDEIDAFLADFCRVETCMTSQGWGDALFVRR